MNVLLRNIVSVFLFSMVSTAVHAEVVLARIFQSNMVLQRDKEVAIWGLAAPGERVRLTFNNLEYISVANKKGEWRVTLPAQVAGGPHEITVSGKTNTVTLKNLLFGDVWICGGQSNMQYTLDQIGFKPDDTAALSNSNIRLFTATIDMDYVPKKDLSGGSWETASLSSLKNFSAVAYFFGKYLQDSIAVPIGLLSINLGATSIETWMSRDALSEFSQFNKYITSYLAPAKSFKQINEAFLKIKPKWEKDYYLQGKGIQEQWYMPGSSSSGWKITTIPSWWEDGEIGDFDGAVWFRKSFDLPEGFKDDQLLLQLNQIDDYDMVWVNGVKVGEGYGNQNWRNYQAPASILKPKENVIVVRVFDAGGKGGMYSNAIWGNPILLGDWHYKKDLEIDATRFKKPHVVNVNPFSSPGILFNGNIAPVTPLAVKGIVWYQGESNAARASEYRELFPALIKDWRKHFAQGDLPFLFAQLANYGQEPTVPGESTWAELREAQASALTLTNTGMAVLIDIGEAGDIHPKNKWEVSRRLGMKAMEVAYHKDESSGPTFDFMANRGDSLVIHYKKTSGQLSSKDKHGYLRGFSIAGSDYQFKWARAHINGNTVVVYANEVESPVAVRYAWSDNPGPLDLYNVLGLPAVPFRTDQLPATTNNKTFTEEPWIF